VTANVVCCEIVSVESDAHESPAPNRAVVRFYNKRGTAEQWIKEGKRAAH
jgi:hypothetical protein